MITVEESRILKNAPILQDEVIVLRPFRTIRDFDYLFELMPKYAHNRVSREQIENLIYKCGLFFWNCYDKITDIKGGVVYLTQVPEFGITLDAYKDDRLAKEVNNRADYSYRAGKLVCQFFFDKFTELLFTTHSTENRGATIVCKRLGFVTLNEYDTVFGKFILMANKGEKYGR